MVDNKDPNKNNDLTQKIAAEEGVKAEEVAKDISEQNKPEVVDKTAKQSFPERLANQEDLNPNEVRKSFSEQMGVTRPDAMNKIWLYVGIVVALGLVAWGIISYFN